MRRRRGRAARTPLAALVAAALLAGPAEPSSLVVTGGAANTGDFGLAADLTATCAIAQNLDLTPPPEMVSGDYSACNELTATGVEVVAPGASFSAGNRIVLGEGFSVASGVPFSAANRNLLSVDPAFVRDDSPADESFYSAALFVDPDDLFLGPGDELVHLSGRAGDDTELFALVLVGDPASPSGKSARVRARLDDASLVAGAKQPLASGYNRLALNWVRSPGGNRGELQLAVNSGPFAGPIHLDNDALGLESVRWGAVSGNPAAMPGSLALDDFQSFRTLPPGPAPMALRAAAPSAARRLTGRGAVPPPTVTSVATAVAGPLAECDTVRPPLHRFEVTLTSQLDLVGADLIANYRLVGAGPDGDFDTGVCSGPPGDDIPIEIVSLSYFPAGEIVSVDLRANGTLAPGLYRLAVCDTITDELGTKLDGDGDGSPGGDFELPFRADPLNRFENGHFDDCPVTLAPWQLMTDAPNEILPGTPGVDDSAASPLSASARVSHAATGASTLAQCPPVLGGQTYDLDVTVRFDAPTGARAVLTRTCEFFDGAGCGGSSLGASSTASVLEDEGGVWIVVAWSTTAPSGAASALCDWWIEGLGTEMSFDAYLDDACLRSSGVIFLDGFESGDTTAWSGSTP